MRGRFTIVLIIAAIAGLIASGLVYRTLSQMRAGAAKGPEVEGIVVAASALEVADVISTRHVRLTPWPKNSIPDGALRKPSDVEGRVVNRAVVPGEPILESKLAAPGVGRSGVLSMLVPEGQRGVTIRVDDAVRETGFLAPNSRVDVLLSMPKDNDRVAKVVLQDVVLLAAGQTVEIRDSKPVPVNTVTLALTPDQAERLTLAQTEGKIVLATRNYKDKAVVKTAGATRQSLLAGSEPAPARKPTVVTAKAPPRPPTMPTPVAEPLPPPKLETHSVVVVRAGKPAESHTFVRSDAAQPWVEQITPEGKRP